MGIDIRIDELSTFMSDRQASPNGVSFILDRSLAVVAHPDQAELLDDNQLAVAGDLDDPPLTFVSDLVARSSGAELDLQGGTTIDDKDYQFATTSLQNNPEWIVAITAPDDDFLARIRDDQRETRIITVIGGALVVALLFIGGVIINDRYRKEKEFGESALKSAIARAEERNLAQAKLSRTVSHLARSNAELEQYAYATAHDLRTPLRAIGGYAELLLREMEDSDPEVDELNGYAVRIVEGYERMCTTMDNLLEHARASAHEPVGHASRLEPALDVVLGNFREDFDRAGAEVVVGPLPLAAVHPVAMQRIFQNLISNAVKYRQLDKPLRIEISGERVGFTSLIRVADNGIGISPEHRDAVFDLFNRVSNDDGGGSGVGLALVKKLVEEHRGTVSVESEEGVGSTFVVSLPAEPVRELPALENV